MIKGNIKYHDGVSTPIVIGTSEDVKAPRGLASLEKSGWPIDENTTIAYKAWLAAKRQGDISTESKFEEWVDTVEDVDLQPTPRQLEEQVALGNMSREQADRLLALIGADSGE